jgi:hypothetical protein
VCGVLSVPIRLADQADLAQHRTALDRAQVAADDRDRIADERDRVAGSGVPPR